MRISGNFLFLRNRMRRQQIAWARVIGLAAWQEPQNGRTERIAIGSALGAVRCDDALAMRESREFLSDDPVPHHLGRHAYCFPGQEVVVRESAMGSVLIFSRARVALRMRPRVMSHPTHGVEVFQELGRYVGGHRYAGCADC